MTAKELALKDIKDSLRQNGKCFLSFKRELNPVINTIVKTYLQKQKWQSHGKAKI